MLTEAGFAKLERVRTLAETWIGISEHFPLPMLVFHEGKLLQAIGPIDKLLGVESVDALLGRNKSEIVEEERLADNNDDNPADKGSVVFKHRTVGRRVAPASIMHFDFGEGEYEVFLVLAGVRAIEKARTNVRAHDSFAGV